MPSAIWPRASCYDANDLGLSADTTLQRLLSCRNVRANALFLVQRWSGSRANPALRGHRWPFRGRKSKGPVQSSLASRRVTCASSADTGSPRTHRLLLRCSETRAGRGITRASCHCWTETCPCSYLMSRMFIGNIRDETDPYRENHMLKSRCELMGFTHLQCSKTYGDLFLPKYDFHMWFSCGFSVRGTS